MSYKRTEVRYAGADFGKKPGRNDECGVFAPAAGGTRAAGQSDFGGAGAVFL